MSCTFHVDATKHLIYSIWTSIEEVMHGQTFAIHGATPKPLLYMAMSWDITPLKLAYLLAHTFD
jgi:hypothetical protein